MHIMLDTIIRVSILQAAFHWIPFLEVHDKGGILQSKYTIKVLPASQVLKAKEGKRVPTVLTLMRQKEVREPLLFIS